MTTEFLVLGPALVALMYISYAANDYIQRRQTLAIAVRNAANLYIPGVDIESDDANATYLHLQHSFKVDLLGIDRADKIIDVITDQGLADAIATDAPAVVSLNEKHLSAYNDRFPRYPSNHEFDSSRLTVGGTVSSTVGSVVHQVTKIFDAIVNFHVPLIGDVRILFDDRPMEATMHMAMRGDADFFSQALIATTNFWGKKDNGYQVVQEQLQSVHAVRHFQRVQAGYHPETYRMQFFIGWMLGKSGDDQPAWGADPNGFDRNIFDNWFTALPGHFTTECMFNLRGGENCRSPLMLARLWDILGTVKAVLCVIQDIFGGGSCTSSNEVWKQAQEELLDRFMTAIPQQIEQQIQNTATEFVDRQLTDFKNTAVTRVKDFVRTRLEDQMKIFAEGFLDETDSPEAIATP